MLLNLYVLVFFCFVTLLIGFMLATLLRNRKHIQIPLNCDHFKKPIQNFINKFTGSHNNHYNSVSSFIHDLDRHIKILDSV